MIVASGTTRMPPLGINSSFHYSHQLWVKIARILPCNYFSVVVPACLRCSRRIAAGQANIRARCWVRSWNNDTRVGASQAEPTITRPSALAPSPQPRQLPRRKRYHQNTSLKGPLLDADRGLVPTPIDKHRAALCADSASRRESARTEFSAMQLYIPYQHEPVFI